MYHVTLPRTPPPTHTLCPLRVSRQLTFVNVRVNANEACRLYTHCFALTLNGWHHRSSPNLQHCQVFMLLPPNSIRGGGGGGGGVGKPVDKCAFPCLLEGGQSRHGQSGHQTPTFEDGNVPARNCRLNRCVKRKQARRTCRTVQHVGANGRVRHKSSRPLRTERRKQ
jgi:hypothetical protein